MSAQSKAHTLKQRLWVLISIPYILGALWTFGHPIVSFVTGELKCRGWFIDESALEAAIFRYDSKIQPARKDLRVSGMCQAIGHVSSSQHDIECYKHDESLEIVKVVPISNAVAPLSESIVFVIPPSDEWLVSPFHNAMLQFTKRLASSESSPWLAKTFLLVSPTKSSNQTMAGTVSTFLDSFLGLADSSTSTLPPSYTTSMIRNLIVIDIGSDTLATSPINEVLLMPQGRRGILPNMDLVFLFVGVFSRAKLLQDRRYGTHFVVHPYSIASKRWKQWVISQVPATRLSLQNWMIELGDMALFLYTLAIGPYPAHAPALERGIDSLTLQIRFAGMPERQQTELMLDCVQWLEGIVRALSNLHERLHHSLTQYVMPSPYKFVSHSEYLIPHLLLILPILIRAVSLILCDIDRFDIESAKIVVFIWALSLGIHEISDFVQPQQLTVLLVMIYGSISMVLQVLLTKKSSMSSLYQSLHFLICLSALYAFIPLVLGHVALAFPSVLLFTPLIAMLPHELHGIRQTIYMPLILIFTWPPLLMLPIFGYYSPYITLVCIPLHLLLYILWNLKRRF